MRAINTFCFNCKINKLKKKDWGSYYKIETANTISCIVTKYTGRAKKGTAHRKIGKKTKQLISDQVYGIRQTLPEIILTVTVNRRSPRTLHSNGSPTNRTTRVRTEPRINTRDMKRVITNVQLPHLFTVNERRQTHRTLPAVLSFVFLLHILHSRHRSEVSAFGCGISGGSAGSQATWPESVRRALDGEEEGVNQSGYSDECQKREN